MREHEDMHGAGTVAELRPDLEAETERSLRCLTEPTPSDTLLPAGLHPSNPSKQGCSLVTERSNPWAKGATLTPVTTVLCPSLSPNVWASLRVENSPSWT